MSTQVCNPCAEVPECWNDFDKYSLQDDLYGDVFTCPPNVFCGPPQTLYLACCDGTTMRQDFPQGITYARRQALINELVARCERRLLFCNTPPPPPPPPYEYFYSAPASCTVYCPDGTPFTYTVPAGTFVSRNLADAQAAAKQLACLRAPLYRICLGTFTACWCADTFARGTIGIDSQHPPFKASVIAGGVPTGIAVTVVGSQVVLSGAPSTAGAYSFTLQVTDAFGNRAVKTYYIAVLSITTAALTAYTVGVPYSFQMQAAGGSGTYVWSITSGTLPEGLEMSNSGLISGTPTGSGAAVTLTFRVADLGCETNVENIYQPHVRLLTVATTNLRIKRGYPVYSGSSLTLYKKITWTGQLLQRAYAGGVSCAGAKYVYSGASEINAQGTFITHHAKNLYVACLRSVYPQVGGEIQELLSQSPVSRLLGYCWTADPNSCSTCSTDDTTWVLEGDHYTDSATDNPVQMLQNSANYTRTPLQYSYNGSATWNATILGVNNMPATVQIVSTGSFSGTLSTPYTDADALASQQTFTTDSAIAENKPDYLRALGNQWLTFVYSRYTTVNFTLTAYNLVIGKAYLLQYQLKDSNGTITTQSVSFVASHRTYAYTGVVPTPESGRSIKIQKATIRYAT